MNPIVGSIVELERRKFLRSAGGIVATGLVAGCLGTLIQNPDKGSQDEGDQLRKLSISSVDTVPDGFPLKPSVKLVRSTITADQTARIKVSVTNTADKPVYTATRIPAFSNFITQDGPQDQQLLLLKPNEQYPTVSSNCWRADLNKPGINHAYTNVVTDIKYTTGETQSTVFDLYGHPRNTGSCFTPGDYPIKTQYSVSDDPNEEDAEWVYTWGFTITVTKP